MLDARSVAYKMLSESPGLEARVFTRHGFCVSATSFPGEENVSFCLKFKLHSLSVGCADQNHCFVHTGTLPQTINVLNFSATPHTLNITVVDVFGQTDNFVYRFVGVTPPREYLCKSI